MNDLILAARAAEHGEKANILFSHNATDQAYASLPAAADSDLVYFAQNSQGINFPNASMGTFNQSPSLIVRPKLSDHEAV